MATSEIGLNKVFPIYTGEGEPFNGLVLRKAVVDGIVMSLGDKITGDVYYKDNALNVTMREYVVYNDVRYYIVNPPTIVREGMVSDNSELKGMTKYSFEFYHPMYMLANFPFTDVAVTSSEERYLSQNKTFSWIGKPQDYIDKLNKNLQGTQWVVAKSDRFPKEKDDVLSEVLSFDNATIADALKTGHDTWDLPFVISLIKPTDKYYSQGKRFLVEYGLPSNEIYASEQDRQMNKPFVFKFGQGVGLKNNSRTPRNNKIITRIAGYGSEDNIPYGYPQIVWEGSQDATQTQDGYPIYDGIVGGRNVKLIKHPFTRTHLMPSIYTETVNKKVNPYASGYNPSIEIKDYYDAVGTSAYPYVNEINPDAPCYESHEFEDIKPELDSEGNIAILGAVPINNDLTTADKWNDAIDDDGNYIQSYFKVTLPILSFDLYACAAITQEMQINMRSGACIGCTFPVQVDWDDYKNNFYDKDGNFAPDGEQRDLTKYPKSNEVGIDIILQKEYSTFGTIMPNIYQQPKDGDNFVILGISLPIEYITNAEKRLDDAMKSYMLENNVYYFDYPLKFDEYFFATHPNILEQIHPNTVVRFEYAGEELQLFVKQMTVKYENKPLPTYNITLTDNIEVVLNQIGQVAEDVERLSSLLSILRQQYSRNVWAELAKKLSKTSDDTAQGFISFIKGLQVGNMFTSGILGEGGVFRKDADGKTYIEADKMYIRMKAYFDNVEIRDYQHTSGNRIVSLAKGFTASRVEWYDDNGNVVEQSDSNIASVAKFRLYWRAKDDEHEAENQFVVGDLAFSQYADVTNSSLITKRYWRLVVGRNASLTEDGEAWIDLSNKATDTIRFMDYGQTTKSLTTKGYEDGSEIPTAEDDVCQLGNVWATDRRGAIIEYAGGEDAPSYQIFQDIGSDIENPYSLNGKNYVSLGYNSSTGRAFLNVYGDVYFGDRPDAQGEAKSYIKYNSEKKEFDIKARINAKSTVGDTSIDEFVQNVVTSSEDINNFIESIVGKDLEEIQKQIDGVIETWFVDEAPTLTNAPAKDWTTEAEKEKHSGDLCYNNTTGTAYRFSKDEKGNWYWNVITDEAITKALAAAKNAQDTADGKRRTFVDTPKPPYDAGDLWVNATYGTEYKDDILRCKANRASGAFDISDWGLASNYTDDTAALAAQKTADEAQAAASNAATQAKQANDRLTDWASDNYISPQEKTALKQQQNDIGSEYQDIINQAGQYGVSTAAFTTAYNSANDALTKYTAATPENILVESDYANIAAYYSARQTILEAIAAKTKEVLDNISPLVAVLSNEFEGIPADASGTIANFPNNCTTTISVFYGTSDVSASATYTAAPNGVTGIWDVNTRTYKVTALSADTGFVEIKASYKGLSVTKRFNVSKVKAGKQGESGKSVQYDAEHSSISYAISAYGTAEAGREYPSDITAWSNTIPAPQKGKYLWTRDITAYNNDGTIEYTTTYGVSYYGTDGTSVEIDTSRTFVRYSTQKTVSQPADNTFTLTSPPALSAGDYLWILSQTAYIGVSETLKSYSVSRIGTDGEDGDKGADGYTTHFAYAKLKSGQTIPNTGKLTTAMVDRFEVTNFSDADVIGTYRDQKSTDSTNIADYIWSQFRGNDGISVNISSTSVTYQAHTNGTIPPTGTWLSSPPTLTAGQYLWTKTVVTYSDGKSTTSYGVSYTGTDGTSVKIKSHSVTYAVTKTESQPSDSAFTSSTVPEVGLRNYLWSKTEIEYSDGTTTKSYSVSRIGGDGEDGVGIPGENGKTTYVHIAYANNGTGTSGFSTTYFTGALYIGTCTDYNQADPTTPASYEWARLKGEDGSSYTENLILNSNFDKGLTSWINWGGPSIREIVAIDNKKWVHIVTTSAYYQGVNQYFTNKVEPNTTYTFSALVRCGDGADRIAVGLHHDDINTTILSQTWLYLPISTVATVVSGTFTTPNNDALAKINLMVGKSNQETLNEFWVTDIKVEKGSNPNPVWSPAPSEMVGKGVNTITEYYLATSAGSGVTTATGDWTTTIQTMNATNQYLWNYEVTTYTDGTSTTTTPVIIGRWGQNGDTGRGIAEVFNYYAVTTNTTAPSVPDASSAPPTGTWQTIPPTLTATKKYLWNYERVRYTSGNTWERTNPHIIAVYGDTGAAGRSYALEASTLTMTRGQDGILTPTSVTFSAYYNDGSTTTRAAYVGRFIIAESMDGSTFTNKFTSTADETSRTYIPTSSDVKSIRCSLYAAGGTSQMLRQVSVAILKDIEGLEIGGRNFVLDSKKTVTQTSAYSLSTPIGAFEGDWLTISFDYEYSNVSTGTTLQQSRFGIEFAVYTASSTVDYTIRDWVTLPSSSSNLSGKGRAINTVTVPKNMLSGNTGYDKKGSDIFIQVLSGTVKISKLKFERGNIATDWSPAPEDVPSSLDYIKEALAEPQTTIDGGLVLTSLIQLGAATQSGGVWKESAGVKARFNNDNEVAAYFGGTLQEAMDGKGGMCVIYHNGKLKAENAEIKGVINATSGVFNGTVNATDGVFNGNINIGNGAIVLNKDGSGSLANGGMSWKANDKTINFSYIVPEYLYGYSGYVTITSAGAVDRRASVVLLDVNNSGTTTLPEAPNTARAYTFINITNNTKSLDGNGNYIYDKGSETTRLTVSAYQTIVLMYAAGSWHVVSKY